MQGKHSIVAYSPNHYCYGNPKMLLLFIFLCSQAFVNNSTNTENVALHMSLATTWNMHRSSCAVPQILCKRLVRFRISRHVFVKILNFKFHDIPLRKIQQDAIMYRNFIISYLYEAQRVLGDTPPIIRSLKLHWKPPVFQTCKVVRRVVGGRCQAQ